MGSDDVLTSLTTELADISLPASSVKDQLPRGSSMSNLPRSSTSSLQTASVVPSKLFALAKTGVHPENP